MKRFGLARTVVTTALVAAAFSPLAQAAGSYANVVVFGDSLSDVGAFGGLPGYPVGNRWTYDTNGKKSDIYADILARKYGISLSPANPANPLLPAGGNGWAQGAAKSSDLVTQLGSYLASRGGKADPNALYSIWIGGNDVTPALTAGQAGGTAAAQAVMATAVQTTLSQIATLKAAGAKHILVLNAPDVGRTPLLFSTVASQAAGNVSATVGTSANATLILTGINPALTNPANPAAATLIAATANALKNASSATLAGSIHSALNAGGADSAAQQTAIANAVTAATNAIVTGYPAAAAKAVADTLVGAGVLANPSSGAVALATYNAVIAGVSGNLSAQVAAQAPAISAGISSGYAQLSSSATSLVDSIYNPALNAGIAQISGGTVIQVDINRLMKEALASPAKFGFGNVTGSACGSAANVCSDKDASFDASKSFFFADPFHPTPEAHKAVAAFIASIMDAPYYAAQLPNNQAIAVNATQTALDERSGQARSVGALDGFARISRLNNDQSANHGALKSDGSNTAVTVGADYQVAANISAGVAFTQSRNKTDFANNVGSFKANNTLMSVFGRYESGSISVSGDVYFGSTRFSDINRRIQLGALNRIESGDTHGTQVGLRAAGSYLLSMGKISVAPTVSLAFGENVVGGYAENCADITGSSSCSTSMRYEKQRVDSLLLGLGAKLNADLGKVQPFASVMFYKDSKDKDRHVGAGQVGQASTFETAVFTPDSSYAVLSLGARAKLGNAMSAYASYTRTQGARDEKRDAISVGVQGTF
ncbi:autotransporter domain-containing protein [Chitinimonas arctica]|uniref:Autotransporter domain-containing protein n=1 Tax=Chitinimonas arctica TaxID=2594795 RepID=A0A516SH16_9NEIS|nr:autotransporter domain-containing protein [Chitinimonas arctica]QDQ27456.1 autotransporter domain-containing protein [Chitinimonas arctica]